MMRPLRWLLVAAALTAFVLGLLLVAGHARQRHLDAMKWTPCGKTGRGYCIDDARSRLAYIPNRHMLLFLEGIDRDFDDKVASALRRFPQAKLLVIQSRGGHVGAAENAARRLNRHAVTVRIENDCVSACALLWALAESRQVRSPARIGLHAGRPGEKVPAWLRGYVNKRARKSFEAALRHAGFPDDAIARGLDTPHARAYWIDVPSMQRMGVAFELIESDPPPLR